jgi:hypothetical protein
MGECPQEDCLFLYWNTLNAFAFDVVTGEGNTFQIVPEDISLVREKLYKALPCELVGRKLEVCNA